MLLLHLVYSTRFQIRWKLPQSKCFKPAQRSQLDNRDSDGVFLFEFILSFWAKRWTLLLWFNVQMMTCTVWRWCSEPWPPDCVQVDVSGEGPVLAWCVGAFVPDIGDRIRPAMVKEICISVCISGNIWRQKHHSVSPWLVLSFCIMTHSFVNCFKSWQEQVGFDRLNTWNKSDSGCGLWVMTVCYDITLSMSALAFIAMTKLRRWLVGCRVIERGKTKVEPVRKELWNRCQLFWTEELMTGVGPG